MLPASKAIERRNRRQRSVRMQIYLPMIAGFVVLVALAVVLFLLPGETTDYVLVTLLLLCPMALILFIVYAVVAAMATGLAKGHQLGGLGLDKVNGLADRLQKATHTTAGVINGASVKFNSTLAPATEAMKSVYDPGDSRPGTREMDGRNDEPQPR